MANGVQRILCRARSVMLLALVLAGCAGINASARLEKFDAMSRLYERAMRWSDFAKAFGLAYQQGATPPDLRRLQDIRVTSYERLGAPQAVEGGGEVVQGVEIRYVHLANMAERRLLDRQRWEYSETESRWYLRSEFPAFP
jgi:hypothetical protein